MRKETKELLETTGKFLQESLEQELQWRLDQVFESACDTLTDCDCVDFCDSDQQRIMLPLTSESFTARVFYKAHGPRNAYRFPDLYGAWVYVQSERHYHSLMDDVEQELLTFEEEQHGRRLP